MRIRALALALALPGCDATAGDSAMSAAQSLAEAESAFAAQSVREDMRAAFLAHFAPDGVFIRDGWTVARDWLQPRGAPPIVLEWRPVHVEVAASGELGLSTGPWKLTGKEKPDAPPAYGQFISVWRRAPGGPWKVEVDLGIDHPAATLWEEPLRTMVHGGERAAASIDEAEAGFARDTRAQGLRAAYAAHASPEIRLYRPGAAPALGREAALARDHGEAPTWTVERSETARSRDLAYARGRYAAPANPQAVAGYFLRVWRVEGGRWRIALDVVNPAARR